jgi:hypothetical protein
MSLVAVVATLALGKAQIDPNIVTWRTYKAGTYSKVLDQKIQVLDTFGDYQRYINTCGPDGAGDGRDIDWGKEELVAIHLGTRNTGGYSVEVSSIAKVNPNEAKVSWAELTPVKGVATTQGQTSPWTIVRINRPGARLTFSGHKEEGRLPGGIKIISFGGYDWGCTCCRACVRGHEKRLPWTVYARGDDAPTLTPSTFVMSSPSDFTMYTRNYRMAALGDGGDVDWYKDRLLAIHLGQKLTPGYEIIVDHVDMIDSRRVDVSYVQVQPFSRSLLGRTSSGTYLILRMPRVGSIVTFSQRVATEGDLLKLDSCDCGCDSCRYCGRH